MTNESRITSRRGPPGGFDPSAITETPTPTRQPHMRARMTTEVPWASYATSPSDQQQHGVDTQQSWTSDTFNTPPTSGQTGRTHTGRSGLGPTVAMGRLESAQENDPLLELCLYNSHSTYEESDELVRVLSEEVAGPSGKALDLRGFGRDVLADVPEQLLLALRGHVTLPMLPVDLPDATRQRWSAALDRTDSATRSRPHDDDVVSRSRKRMAVGDGPRPLSPSAHATTTHLASLLCAIDRVRSHGAVASMEQLDAFRRAVNSLASDMRIDQLDNTITDAASDVGQALRDGMPTDLLVRSLYEACNAYFPDGLPVSVNPPANLPPVQAQAAQPGTNLHLRPGRARTLAEAVTRHEAMYALLAENPNISARQLTARLNALSKAHEKWEAVSEAGIAKLCGTLRTLRQNEPGNKTLPVQIYRMIKADPGITREEVIAKLSEGAVQSAGRRADTLRYFHMLEIAIDNGYLDVPSAYVEAGAKRQDTAERDLRIFKLVASDQSITPKQIKNRMGEDSPTVQVIESVANCATQICRDIGRKSSDASTAAGALFLLLQENPDLRSHDKPAKKKLLARWLACDVTASENVFRIYRGWCLLAIDNDVFKAPAAT